MTRQNKYGGHSCRAELLAPAGSFQSVVAAVNAGADAVYMGGRRFGARAYAESAEAETEDMVLEAIRYCHLFNVKLYITVNVLFKDAELKELFSYIKPYYEAGADGLIVQDLGAVKMLREWFPDQDTHAPTQMTITGTQGAVLARKLGMTRAVLARELSLAEIGRIHAAAGIELEVFIHGAMCYSYSGACFMSSLLGGRSGNRGRCAGTCRLCYEAAGRKGYYLSMKDMSVIEMLPELLSAGAYSFKIEGRMKTPLYTAGVVSVYRKYLDLALENPEHYKTETRDLRILQEMFDRGGTASYLKQHNGQDMIAVSEKKFRPENREITEQIRTQFLETDRRLPLEAFLKLHPQEKAELILTDQDGISVSCTSEDDVQPAESRPILKEDAAKQIKKSGGTAFEITDVTVQMDEAVFIPLGKLNQLRRDALSGYEEKKLESTRRKYQGNV